MPLTHIILPYKEVMTEKNAGAVAAVVAQHAKLSSVDQNFQVFGQMVNVPTIPGIDYVPIKPSFSWARGRNIGFARAYVQKLNMFPRPDVVEVHGRAQVARFVCQKRPDLPVILYLHNDPRDMKGAKTEDERLWLIKNLAGVICVSNYIKSCFLDGLEPKGIRNNSVQSVLNGTAKSEKLHLPKEKSILLIGRMVPEKGILPACQAIAKVLEAFPDWKLHVVGGRHFRKAPPSNYEKHINKAVSAINGQVHLHGFQPASFIRTLQNKAAISVVPSLWAEPCGLTGLEALAAGSALITTNAGGIPEYASGRAVMINLSGTERDDQNAELAFKNALAQELHHLINNRELREDLQKNAFNDFPFTAENMVDKANKVRQDFLSRFTNTQL